ncbi:MAG: YfhO family protein [Bacilli bacterium]|nr:YfhO family protein [Bacilli bacterium]
MKKSVKENVMHILVIIAFILLYVVITTNCFEYLYGSTVDWDCQHWSIPDYFRKLFYSTGDLIPNFAFNLGNGQNIFYFSYYGLFSPIIMFSYLLPFVEMVDYIQIISIIGLIVSSVLMYKWLLGKYDSKISFLTTISFITFAPVLFHSHRHIMFTNYFPFLLLGLMGVDKYFSSNKKWLLILSSFLIVMTNYFFSVSALFVIVIYGIYSYCKEKKLTCKNFFVDGFKFLLPIIIGVLMASVIILPTFYVIVKGRSESNVAVDFISLFYPQLDVKKIFYSSYSSGITFFAFLLVLINVFRGKKVEKGLAISLLIMLIVPFFAYILNGTMYVDNKVFITFIPLISLLIANGIKIYLNLENKKSLIISAILGMILFFVSGDSSIRTLFFTEIVFVFCLLFGGIYFKKKNVFIYLAFFASACISVNSILDVDTLYKRNSYTAVKNSMLVDEVSSVLKKDPNIYRISNYNYLLQNINSVPNINYFSGSIYSSTSNKYYKDYFYNNTGNEITERSFGKITSSMNIFYNLQNANKYFIANEYAPIGYIKQDDNFYINNDVLPIIYASSNVMSEKTYENLSFPYNMEADLKNIIVSDDVSSNFESNLVKIDVKYELIDKFGINILSEDDNYIIEADKDNYIKLSVNDLDNDDILMIKFNVENNKKCPGDLSIVINGIENVLTCKSWKYHNKNSEFNYVISSNDGINLLDITLLPGVYNISDISWYKINYSDISNTKQMIDEFNFSKEKSFGDSINGNINVTEDGYLYMSIPYDDGFKIYLNDDEYSYEKVDNSFIGVKVKKGNYNVRIEYEAPLLKEGIIMSSIGFISFFVIFLKEIKKKS